MLRSGRIAEAIAIFDQAAADTPDEPHTRSNALFARNYNPALPAKELFDEHVAWGRRMGELVPPITEHANNRDPDRRLRIGYVSADFRLHSVAFFLTAMLERRDRKQVEIFCYSTSAPEDAMTRRMRALSDHWRPMWSGSRTSGSWKSIRQDGDRHPRRSGDSCFRRTGRGLREKAGADSGELSRVSEHERAGGDGLSVD